MTGGTFVSSGKHLPFAHEENKLLASFTTFGIGGPARYFAQAKSISDIETMLGACQTLNIPFFILGKGSNILFDDRGFNGLVILNRLDYIEQQGATFRVGSGFSFPRLGQVTAKRGFGGLEFAAGIPATLGGALFMNAGAGKHETATYLKDVLYLHADGKKILYKSQELEFGYRHSSFQKWKGVILEATFELFPSESASKMQRELVDYRLKTQPYKDKSAGCIFRNPLPNIAGRLIEECGLKGEKVGGAEVSSMHANFLINSGGATAADILALIAEVKARVYKEKGIVLEDEVRYIPYEG